MKPRLSPRHVAVGVVLVGLGWLLNSASQSLKRSAKTSTCQSNLKQISLAIFQYQRDYDECFPLAPNWADSLTPYSFSIKSTTKEAEFQQRFRCPTSEAYYAFNEFCASQSVSTIGNWKTLTTVPMVFDVAWGQHSFSDNGSLWPLDPPIHGSGKHGGNNVAFADGHVKLMTVKPKFRPFATPTPTPRAKTNSKRKP